MFILVNLKTCPCDPIEVTTAACDVAEVSGARIVASPQAADISRVADTGVETWAQYVDPNGHGSHTGSTLAEAVAEAGAVGTLINHSEKHLRLADIDGSVRAAERTGLETCVRVSNPAQTGAVSVPGLDPIAVEPPELIGDDVPVATADPDIVIGVADAAANVDEDVETYCGVGISIGDNVVTTEELGASGTLLASGVTKADDPRAALKDLVSGL